MEERSANAELENQVNQEQRARDTLTAEFKVKKLAVTKKFKYFPGTRNQIK